MKKILSAFVIGGLSVSNVCYGDNPWNLTKVKVDDVIQKVTDHTMEIKSRVESNIRSIKKTSAIRKYNRKIRNLVKNPNFRTTVGVSALIGGGIAAYYYIPDLLKLVSRYFEGTSRLVNAGQKVVENIGNSDVIKAKGTSRLVNAGQKVAENIGNSDVIKATGWTKVINVAKKYGPYAAVISVVSLVSLVRAEIEIKQLEGKLNDAQNNLKESNKNLETAKTQYNQLTEELETAKTQYNELAEELETAKNEKEQAQKEITDLKNELETAKTQYNQLTEELEIAQNDLKESNENLKAAKNEKEQAQKEITKLKNELETAETQYNELTEELKTAKNEKEQAQNNLKKAKEKIEQQEAQENIGEFETKLKKAQKKIIQLEEELKTAKNEKEQSQNNLKKAQEKNNQLEEALNNAKNALEKSNENLETAKNEKEQVQEEIKQLTKKLEEAEKENKQAQEKITKLKNELETTKNEKEQVQNNLEKAKNELKTSQERIKQLTEELEKAQNNQQEDQKKIEQLTEELNDAQEEKVTLSKKLGELIKESLKKAQNECEQLENKIQTVQELNDELKKALEESPKKTDILNKTLELQKKSQNDLEETRMKATELENNIENLYKELETALNALDQSEKEDNENKNILDLQKELEAVLNGIKQLQEELQNIQHDLQEAPGKAAFQINFEKEDIVKVLSGASKEELKEQYDCRKTDSINSLTFEKNNETIVTVFFSDINKLCNENQSSSSPTDCPPTAVEYLGANSDQSVSWIQALKESSNAAYTEGSIFLHPYNTNEFCDEEGRIYDNNHTLIPGETVDSKKDNVTIINENDNGNEETDYVIINYEEKDGDISIIENYPNNNQNNKGESLKLENITEIYNGKKEYMGFVRKIGDKLIVAFPGTKGFKDALIDIDAFWGSNDNYINGDYKVHSGFAKEVMSFFNDLIQKIKDQNEDKKIKEIWFTGHSKGGGEAILAALRFAIHVRGDKDLSVFKDKNRIKVFTFSAPAVVDKNTRDVLLYNYIGNHNIICAHRKPDIVPVVAQKATNAIKLIMPWSKNIPQKTVETGIQLKLAQQEGLPKAGDSAKWKKWLFAHFLSENYKGRDYETITNMIQYVNNNYDPVEPTEESKNGAKLHLESYLKNMHEDEKDNSKLIT